MPGLTIMAMVNNTDEGAGVSTMAPGQKAPDDLLRGLFNRGLTPTQVRLILWQDHDIMISVQGLSKRRQKMGYGPLRKTTEWNFRLIPWRIAQEHSADPLYRALATEARLRDVRDGIEGATVPTRPSRQQHERVKDELGKNLVIQYDREVGFFLTDRRKGIDKDWIHEPRILDDGSRVTGPVEGLRR